MKSIASFCCLLLHLNASVLASPGSEDLTVQEASYRTLLETAANTKDDKWMVSTLLQLGSSNEQAPHGEALKPQRQELARDKQKVAGSRALTLVDRMSQTEREAVLVVDEHTMDNLDDVGTSDGHVPGITELPGFLSSSRALHCAFAAPASMEMDDVLCRPIASDITGCSWPAYDGPYLIPTYTSSIGTSNEPAPVTDSSAEQSQQQSRNEPSDPSKAQPQQGDSFGQRWDRVMRVRGIAAGSSEDRRLRKRFYDWIYRIKHKKSDNDPKELDGKAAKDSKKRKETEFLSGEKNTRKRSKVDNILVGTTVGRVPDFAKPLGLGTSNEPAPLTDQLTDPSRKQSQQKSRNEPSAPSKAQPQQYESINESWNRVLHEKGIAAGSFEARRLRKRFSGWAYRIINNESVNARKREKAAKERKEAAESSKRRMAR